MLMASLTSQVTIDSRHFETVTVITFTVTKSFGKNGNRDVQKSQHITFISHLPCNCQQRSDEISIDSEIIPLKIKWKLKNTVVMKPPPPPNEQILFTERLIMIFSVLFYCHIHQNNF